jgi:hypothetical protein
MIQGAIERLDRAASALAALQGELAELQLQVAHRRAARRVQAPLDEMAAFLAARSWRAPLARPEDPAFVAAMAQEALHRRHAPFTVPQPPSAPEMTVLLLAAPDCADSIAALRVLAVALGGRPAQLLLADDGADPRTALLPTVARGLHVSPPVSLSNPDGAACALNAAAASARGASLLLLRADAAPPSATALGQLFDAVAAAPDQVLVGGGAVASLARWGLTPPGPGPALAGPLDLMLAVPRALWREAGGLNPAQEDGAGLELADLCLKLRLLGARPQAVRGPAGLSVPRVAPDPARAWQAALRFREAWGDPGRAGAAP